MAKRSKSTPKRCPHCGNEDYVNRKKGGLTRCCGKKVYIVEGKWVKDRYDTPIWKVLGVFIEEMREHLGDPSYDIPYGSKTYATFSTSVKRLLKMCAGDEEVAARAVRMRFHHRRYDWPARKGGISNFFSVMANTDIHALVATARIEEMKSRERDREQARRANRVASSSNLESAYVAGFSI